MTKLTLNDITNFQSSAVTTINNNSASIETAMENTLSRNGEAPNEMNATLDMNSNRILNLPYPVDVTEPVRLGDLATVAEGTIVTPSSSTDNAVVRWNGTSGKSFQDSGVLVDDGANLTVPSKGWFGAAGQNSWNTVYSYGNGGGTPLNSVSQYGGPAVYGASRSSDGNGGASAAIGLIGWGFSDSTVHDVFTWGGYFEARRYPNAPGGATGVEIDSTNLNSLVSIGPYSPYKSGATHALWLAAGGNTISNPAYNPATGLSNLTATTSSVGLGIVYNEATFDIGLMFGAGAISGADGTVGGGYGKAIVMGQHHDIEWWGAGGTGNVGTPLGRIRSNVSTKSGQLTFFDDCIQIKDISNTATWLQVEGGATTVNGVRIIPAATGQYPAFTPTGSDSNLGFVFNPKGTPSQTVYINGRTMSTTEVQIGANGAATGKLRLDGTTSGSIYIIPQDVAGSYNFNLPTTAGSSGNILTSGGGGASPMTWTGTTGTGSVVMSASPTLTGTATVNNITMTGTVFTATSATAFMPQFTMYNTTTDANGGYFILQKSRSGGPVSTSDVLGNLVFKGYDSGSVARNSVGLTARASAVAAGSVRADLEIGNLVDGTVMAKFPGAAATSGQAALLLLVNDGSVTSLRQVTVGDADSGGSGFRLLRVPN